MGVETLTGFGDITAVTEDLNMIQSTGLIDGGELTINGGDNTKFDIAAGNGIVVDSYTDPNNPTFKNISWDAIIAIPGEFLSLTSTIILINGEDEEATVDNVVQQVAFPIGTVLRDHIQIGAFGQAGGVFVSNTDFTQCPIQHTAQTLTDLQAALGVINLGGNVLSGNATNGARFDLSAGNIMYAGIQYKADKKNPNLKATPARTQPFVTFSWRDGSGGFNTGNQQSYTFGVYDDNAGGGTVAPTTSCTTNQWSVARMRKSPDLDQGTQAQAGLTLEYGQELFSTEVTAAAAVTNGTILYDTNPALIGLPIRAHVLIRCGGGDFADIADAMFIIKDKFGTI